MNEQNLNVNPVPVTEPITPAPKRKILDLVKEVLGNFYSNKKLLRVFVAILAIIILIVITGLIFSALKSRKGSELATSPTPEPTMSSETERINENEVKLKALKEKIINLDIYQKRLSPPSVNFDISF